MLLLRVDLFFPSAYGLPGSVLLSTWMGVALSPKPVLPVLLLLERDRVTYTCLSTMSTQREAAHPVSILLPGSLLSFMAPPSKLGLTGEEGEMKV